jgi:hypothetical protein
MKFPTRTPDTMSDAIALSSPSGRMSHRAKSTAQRRLAIALFGPTSTREDFTGSDTRDKHVKRLERIEYRMRDLRQLCARQLNSARSNAVKREMASLEAERKQLLEVK